MKKTQVPYVGIKFFIITWLLHTNIVIAHDTNTTHPRMTIAAGELIESNDESIGAYYDLWKRVPEIEHETQRGVYIAPLLGQDPRFNETLKETDEEGSPVYNKFRHELKNVLGGVVMEDEPIARVVSHFQHAYTGGSMSADWSTANFLAGTLLGRQERSEDTAKRFFMIRSKLWGIW